MSVILVPLCAGIVIASTAFALVRFRGGALVFGDEPGTEAGNAAFRH